MNKIKNYSIILIFAAVVFGLGIWHLAAPDGELSTAERRKLAQAPELSAEIIFSGEYMEDLESYLLDQFPMRDGFRTVKAMLRFNVFGQSDNNDIYLHNDSVCKMEYPLDENQLEYGIGLFNSIQEQYLQGMNVYYSVIPDKNYFAYEESGHMHMDYDKLLDSMHSGLSSMSYIDIFPLLELDDYYRTDSHWKQECIHPVAEALAIGMGAEDLTPFGE